MDNKKNTFILILIIAIIIISLTLILTKKNNSSSSNSSNKFHIALHSKRIPSFKKTKDCSFLPVDKIDAFLKLKHKEVKFKTPLKDVKACNIIYPNNKKLIFEYDENISLESSKETANILDGGYITFKSIKTPHICPLGKKTHKILQITFKVDDKSIISVRTDNIKFTKQEWEQLGKILEEMF